MTIIKNRELSTLKRKKNQIFFISKFYWLNKGTSRESLWKRNFNGVFDCNAAVYFWWWILFTTAKYIQYILNTNKVISILPRGGRPIKKSYFSLKIMGDNSILHFHEHIAHAFLDIWPHFLSSPLFLVLKVIPFLVTLLPFFECTLDYLYGVCNYTIK